jgi:hypothetical protein
MTLDPLRPFCGGDPSAHGVRRCFGPPEGTSRRLRPFCGGDPSAHGVRRCFGPPEGTSRRLRPICGGDPSAHGVRSRFFGPVSPQSLPGGPQVCRVSEQPLTPSAAKVTVSVSSRIGRPFVAALASVRTLLVRARVRVAEAGTSARPFGGWRLMSEAAPSTSSNPLMRTSPASSCIDVACGHAYFRRL